MIRRVVVCDECLIEAESTDGVITATTGATARSLARLVGWQIMRRRDLCPDCSGARP